MNKKLTIGITHFGNYCAIHSTIQSIRLYHSDILDDIEIIVLDSHPMNSDGDQLKLSLLSNEVCGIPIRYIADNKCKGTASKQMIIDYVSTPYFLCVESGTLLLAGSIKKLIQYFDENVDDSFGIVQGVEFDFSLNNYITHTNFIWNNGVYGIDTKDINAEVSSNRPFSVNGARLNTFAGRIDKVKNIKLFNERFLANSSEMDNLYCDKVLRQHGFSVGCLPFLRYTCSNPIKPNKVKFKIEALDVYNYATAFILFNMQDDLNILIEEKKSIMDERKILDIIEKVKKYTI